MSAENHHESGPQNPEQKEWQGQRWEYLTLRAGRHWGSAEVIGRLAPGSTSKQPRFVDSTIETYNQKIKQLRTQAGIEPSDLFNLLGNDGWELINMYDELPDNMFAGNIFFFKRPKG